MINLHKVPQDEKKINLSAALSIDIDQKDTTALKQHFLGYVNVGLAL